MKFIRFPVKLEFNLCTLDRRLLVRDGYTSGTIAGARCRGWNQLPCLDFGERSVRKMEKFLGRKIFLQNFLSFAFRSILITLE